MDSSPLQISIVVLAGVLVLIRPISSGGSLEKAFDAYTSNSCSCGIRYADNCAHYLSNALIKGGFSELDGGNGKDLRKERNGMIVCRTGRPVRAKELRNWFKKLYGRSYLEPRVGVNLVYQERMSNGQGHVLLKKYTQKMVINYHNKWPAVTSKGQNFRGTADFDGEPGWFQEFLYPH